MLYYLGETFNKEKNKSYKTLDGGQKAAEREGLNLYDEGGNLVHEGKKPEADAQKPEEAPEGNQVENSAPETEKGQEGASGEATGASEEDVKPEADAQKPEENSAPETEKGQEGASGEATGASEEDVKPEDVTLTDDVPEDALTPNADGSVNVYDEDGQKAGTISEEEAKELEEKAGEQLPGVTPVRGKIRRIFDGLLRIRKRPSWDESACIGVTKFVEKDVVALHLVDGKPMYETTDGYFITGSKTLVEFIAR